MKSGVTPNNNSAKVEGAALPATLCRTIETGRLLLRPFSLVDVDDLHQLWIEPGVRRYLWDDEVIPREQAASIVEKSLALFEAQGFGLWAVFLRAEEVLIGFCGFWFFHEPPKLELLYGIAPAYWNTGFATEVARVMMKYAFEELSFERIQASTDAANEASSRVMEKSGLKFWKRELTNGQDTVYYALLREEFHAGSPF